MRRIHVGIGQNQNPDFLACLDVGEYRALFIEQVGSDRYRQDGADLGTALLHGLFFDQAHDRK